MIVSFSTKRLPFSYIYSLTGFFLFFINIFDRIKKNKIVEIYLFIVIFLLREIFHSNFYFSIFINILISSYIFVIFLLLPFEKINNDKYIYFIKQITSYTAGIYYLHTKIRDFLINYIIKKKSLTMMQCFINYLLCYSICFIGSKIFKNYNLKYMFI